MNLEAVMTPSHGAYKYGLFLIFLIVIAATVALAAPPCTVHCRKQFMKDIQACVRGDFACETAALDRYVVCIAACPP